MKTFYFKVQISFDKDGYISIDQHELPMAIRAQITGKVGVFREGTISGDKIISITPDYAKMMGWNRGYTLTGEDYKVIGNAMIRDVQTFIETTKSEQLGTKQLQLT